AGHGRRLQGLVPGLHRTSRQPRRMTIRSIWNAIASVALKEFLHVWRDKRILALILVLPPFFTLLFGYAFEAAELIGVPATIIDRDRTEHSAKLAELLGKKKTFTWKKTKDTGSDPDLLHLGVSVALL